MIIVPVYYKYLLREELYVINLQFISKCTGWRLCQILIICIFTIFNIPTCFVPEEFLYSKRFAKARLHASAHNGATAVSCLHVVNLSFKHGSVALQPARQRGTARLQACTSFKLVFVQRVRREAKQRWWTHDALLSRLLTDPPGERRRTSSDLLLTCENVHAGPWHERVRERDNLSKQDRQRPWTCLTGRRVSAYSYVRLIL